MPELPDHHHDTHEHDVYEQDEPTVQHHHHCGNLFGCGDEQGTGVLREDLKDAALTKRSADRLLHMDEMDQEILDGYLNARGRARRKLLRASSFMGMLAAVGPWFSKLAYADEPKDFSGSAVTEPPEQAKGKDAATHNHQHAAKHDDSKVHVVESNKETVHLGVFDANLPPVIKIDSGDSVSFPNTWSHFMNEMQPGVPVDRLAELRKSNPGRGPHSIIVRFM